MRGIDYLTLLRLAAPETIVVITALAVLAVIGYAHRARTLGPASTGRLAPLLSLTAGELLIMGATTGLAVVLSTTG